MIIVGLKVNLRTFSSWFIWRKAPVPYPPVMHSLASASTLAWLIHQKFELGIPLYRQEKEWEALGLRLSRATMSNWLVVIYRD